MVHKESQTKCRKRRREVDPASDPAVSVYKIDTNKCSVTPEGSAFPAAYSIITDGLEGFPKQTFYNSIYFGMQTHVFSPIPGLRFHVFGRVFRQFGA